jgi:hypothetical protein
LTRSGWWCKRFSSDVGIGRGLSLGRIRLCVGGVFARGGLGALLGRLGGASRRGAGVGSPHDDDDVLNYRVG